MDLQTLRKRVAFIVRGSSTNLSTTLSDQIDHGLNEALRYLHNKVLMMGLRKDSSVTLVADQAEYALPAGFIKILSGTVYCDAQPAIAMMELAPQDFTRSGGASDTTTGVPRAFWINDYDVSTARYQMRMVPTPGTAEAGAKVYFKYHAMPTEMALDADVPDIPEHLHDVLIHGAIILSLNKMVEPMALQLHTSAWKDGVKLAAKTSDPLMGRRTPLRQNGIRRQGRRSAFDNFTIDDP